MSKQTDQDGDMNGRLGFSDQDARDIEENSRLRAPMIYEILRREGEEEMNRPLNSLWWSGVLAGLSISFSLLAQAILQSRLPDVRWRHLVSCFGYSMGFLLVVLARQQLFTENTITAVLPIMKAPTLSNFGRLGRMWGIVLSANLFGTLAGAVFCSFTPVVPPELRDAMLQISQHMIDNSPTEMFVRGISAGFLIASMVWLIPSAEGEKFLVVTLLTYTIAVGGFTHIVAGSMEAFMLVINRNLDLSQMITGFVLPVLSGNIIGGTLLFSLISYAQVAKEV